MNNNYDDVMDGPMEGIDYNYDLIDALQYVINEQFPG
jgi:hypothetical protein